MRICLISLGIFLVWAVSFAQIEIIDTLETTMGSTNEVLWLQIPEDYDSTVATPLLFGWHGWGGDHLQMRNMTTFNDEANLRNWLAASMRGPNPFHWTTHTAQSNCIDVLNWIDQRYNVDHDRLYMVGGSMGGAAGMVFHNNNLDPNDWMCAATASGSGIMDCHRRFLEQGVNISMIRNFGGTPDSVPYQYHRHSAVYFADSTESMHYNLRHLPMYYTFGLWESPWMEHARDLYRLIHLVADTVYMVMASWPSHGWESMNPEDICNWLDGFSLNHNPDDISINADQDDRYYWVYVNQWDSTEAFTRFDAAYDSTDNSLTFHGWWNLEWALLDLDMMGINPDSVVRIEWTVEDTVETLRLSGYSQAPLQVLKNGSPTPDWSFNAFWGYVSITSDTGYSVWEIYPQPSSVPSWESPAVIGAGDFICQAFPNPFNPVLHVTYQVETPGYVRLKVFDILGREMAVLADGNHRVGMYQTMFNGRNHASGVYIAQLESRSGTHQVKVVLLK
jgi:hypothetical protein